MTSRFFRLIAIVFAWVFLIASLPSFAEKERKLPYYCDDLQVDAVADVKGVNKKRTYSISGICEVRVSKDPLQYQKLWLEIKGIWDNSQQSAIELVKIVAGAKGTFNVIMKCKEDPFMSDGVCVVQAFDDSSDIEAFAAIFKDHPPIARNIITPEKAQYLSEVDVAKKTGAAMPEPFVDKSTSIKAVPAVPNTVSQPSSVRAPAAKPETTEMKPAEANEKPEVLQEPASQVDIQGKQNQKKKQYIPLFDR